MELLTVEHEDFTMYIECTKFDDIWKKAKGNVGEDNLHSTYSWSAGVLSVIRTTEAGNTEEIIAGDAMAKAFFFDNTDYSIWVDFKVGRGVRAASFGSMLQSDNERFRFRHGTLAGFLNYGNDIGRSEINLIYQKTDGECRFTFGFEVLSTKLNYHEHWKKILEDIEQEYRMLSIDYMRRTFHGFAPDVEGDTPELVWWSVFAGEQAKFVKACRTIIERPRHRLRGKETFVRADKLKCITAQTENELAEHEQEPAYLYRVEEQIKSNDTTENRFLKFALTQITNKYSQLKKRIEAIKGTSEVLKKEMNEVQQNLSKLQHNPFFRTVGSFKGLNQDSQILQKATGYSQIFRTWNVLRRAYSLNDGIYRLQTKDIATLYEIWCFIEVSHIVRDQLGLTDDDVDHRNRMEMNGLFTWELGKGEHSRILFRKDGVELAELVYNPKHTDRENDNISMDKIVVPTVAQKPDIVLQLTKNDLQKDMKMTYLFDAKYRIDGKKENVDVPPEDAINQLHRYRDAIYYKDYTSEDLKKEVIGGYILFPGDGEPSDIAVSRFYKTIEQVNIGAFPLRPKDDRNRKLLEEFIAKLIASKSADIVKKVIPQKGVFTEVGDRVLVGLVKSSSRAGYLQSFEEGNATLYYTGAKFPTTIPLQDLHFFIPYMKGKGIRDVYEIKLIRTITASEAKQTAEGTNDLRLAFELAFSRKLSEEYRAIDARHFVDYTFLDTTFEKLGV